MTDTTDSDVVDNLSPHEVAEEVKKHLVMPVCKQLSPHGDRIIYKIDGHLVQAAFHIDVSKHESMLLAKDDVHDMMQTLAAALTQIDEMKRDVPTTRNEMEGWGVTLKTIDRAVKEKLVVTRPVKIEIRKDGKRSKAPARACVYPTHLGRVYIKKFIDESYLSEDKDIIVGFVDENGKGRFYNE